MNISDAERIAAVLDSAKYKKAADIDEADLIVVAMCSVRQSAVNRVHGLVQKFNKLKAKNHKLKTILTGCVLKKDKKKFSKIFDYILDIKDLPKWPRILKNNIYYNFKSFENRSIDNYLDITPKYLNKFSANVPIMTGCNNFCAYCVVPYTREREISRSVKDIIQEIKNITNPASPPPSHKASDGQRRLRRAKEIWLLGQNVNSYKDKNVNFPKLLKIVNNIQGNFWIRFTSSHPKDFNDEVIKAMATCKKVTPYLNLPAQSGDNKVLKLMNRHYTVKDYKNKIKKLREKIPNISISTDIIVGFPGETKKQFENTAKLFRGIKFDMAYINKYSKRAGTAAANLKDNVSIAEKKRREKVLTEILKETALEKNKKIIGKETLVLIDSNRGDNWFGKNENYKTIKVASIKNILGKLVKVKIIEAQPFVLKGELINEK